ncbi:MAG: hypothetical protein F4073_09395 [Rhodobacteraceae bacterium]|nr:hypothetical protein [Paracoccaceae bacterium]MYF46375.1 hypothetical protein [Paracoccaceae bacterium]MYI92154.1 hypothetical protein [Paracoccaceae bacterium]
MCLAKVTVPGNQGPGLSGMLYLGESSGGQWPNNPIVPIPLPGAHMEGLRVAAPIIQRRSNCQLDSAFVDKVKPDTDLGSYLTHTSHEPGVTNGLKIHQ